MNESILPQYSSQAIYHFQTFGKCSQQTQGTTLGTIRHSLKLLKGYPALKQLYNWLSTVPEIPRVRDLFCWVRRLCIPSKALYYAEESES